MAPFRVIILASLLLCLVISDIFAIDVSLLNPNAQPAGPSPVARPSATGGVIPDYMTGGQLVKPDPVPVDPVPVPVDPVPMPVDPVPMPVDPVVVPVEPEPILVGPDTVVKPDKPVNTLVVNPDTTTDKVSLKIKTLAVCNGSLSKVPKQRFYI